MYSQSNHDQEFWRAILLAGIAHVGMGMLGIVAMLTAVWPSFRIGGMVLPFIVGLFVGVPSFPFVMAGLIKTKLRYSLPFVYAGAAFVVAVYVRLFSGGAYWDPPIDAALPALVAVCCLSVIAPFVLPRIKARAYWECPMCGYDMRGGIPGCPECGWGREGN